MEKEAFTSQRPAGKLTFLSWLPHGGYSANNWELASTSPNTDYKSNHHASEFTMNSFHKGKEGEKGE